MQSAGTESIRASQRSENVAAGCVRMLEWRSGSVAEPVLICRALAAWEKPCDSTRLNTESLEQRVAGFCRSLRTGEILTCSLVSKRHRGDIDCAMS